MLLQAKRLIDVGKIHGDSGVRIRSSYNPSERMCEARLRVDFLGRVAGSIGKFE